MMNKLFSIISLYTLVLLSSVHLSAQGAAAPAPTRDGTTILDLIYNNIFVFLAVLVLVGVVLAGLNLVWALIDLQKIKLIDKHGPEIIEKAGWAKKASVWDGLYQKLSGLKPIDQEKDIEMNHDYDGIRELDNSLPPWWLYLFYITIIWSVGYLIYYHAGGNGPNQEEEYMAEMAAGEEQKAAFLATQAALVDENTVSYLTDPVALAEGKEVYLANCVACHGSNGEGNAVGPNLTDPYWIHGGSIKNIFSTIKYGVVQKGMQSWQQQLRPESMQKVSSYILSLQGSNPPNAKGPQGDLYDATEEAAGDTSKMDTIKTVPAKVQ